jgi:hypothetical protein
MKILHLNARLKRTMNVLNSMVPRSSKILCSVTEFRISSLDQAPNLTWQPNKGRMDLCIEVENRVKCLRATEKWKLKYRGKSPQLATSAECIFVANLNRPDWKERVHCDLSISRPHFTVNAHSSSLEMRPMRRGSKRRHLKLALSLHLSSVARDQVPVILLPGLTSNHRFHTLLFTCRWPLTMIKGYRKPSPPFFFLPY